MVGPLPPDEWDRRAAVVGVEWTGERPTSTKDKRPARCRDCGTEWEANAGGIATGRKGCPDCAKRQRADGRAYSRDEWDRRAAAVGAEWVGDEPVRGKAPHPARCLTCGHEWDAHPGNVQQGRGCPACAIRRRGRPRITADEWHRRAAAAGLEWVDGPPAGAEANTRARCLTCGHEWTPLAANVNAGHGCPPCANAAAGLARRLARDEWDRRAAAVGMEWTGEPPTATGHAPARCLTCGHEWTTSGASVSAGSGCPRCGEERARATFRERHGITPDEWHRRAAAVGIAWAGDPPATTDAHAPARCLTCGHEWQGSGASVSMGGGCPACAGVLPVPPEERQRRARERGVEWVGNPPTGKGKGLARCLVCGHEWRTMSAHGCPSCAGILPRTRDEWDRLAEAAGVEWVEEPPRSNTAHALARCLTCGREYRAHGGSVATGRGCRPCALARGGLARRLPRAEWDRRAAAAGVAWTADPPPTTTGYAPARCLRCGYEWQANAGSVSAGSGCPACAVPGLDPTAPASLYLVALLDRGLVKVGVMNRDRRADRLGQHRRRGWEVVARWDVADGREALRVESAVLAWWRESGAVFATRDEVPAGDGYTEAVHGADVPRVVAYVDGLLRR